MEQRFAKVLAEVTTGIYVLTVADGGIHHGMSSSWVTQVSGEPVLIMAAVDNNHFSLAAVKKAGAFGLNIVGQKSRFLEDYFLSSKSRRPDNLVETPYELSPGLGVPWLSAAMASVEARVVDTAIAGDHTLLIAEPAGVRFNEPDRPLVSFDFDYAYLGGKQIFMRAALRASP